MMILLPGDIIQDPTDQSHLKIGPGIHQQDDHFLASKAGVLHSESSLLWLDSKQKKVRGYIQLLFLKYIPSNGESVLGVILSRHANDYRVDIAGPHMGCLPLLAFEGATKRNRPNLDVGTLVYCRISQAHKDMDPELECINPTNGKADGYGELKGGFVVNTSLKLARELLNPEHPILKELSRAFPFELAIGLNGRIWINAESCQQIILISKIIKLADGLAPSKLSHMVSSSIRQEMDNSK